MTALAFRVLIVAAASFRLARAVAVDSISEPFRFWVARHAFVGIPPDMVGETYAAERRSRGWAWVYGLVSCPYCAGFWISLTLFAVWAAGRPARLLVAAVAAAGVQAFLTGRDQ